MLRLCRWRQCPVEKEVRIAPLSGCAHGDLEREGLIVQLGRFGHDAFADGAAKGRECAVGDLACALVAVEQIEPFGHALAGERAVKDQHLELQILPGAVFGGAHVACDDLRGVGAGGPKDVAFGRVDEGGIEDLGKHGHG